MATSTGAAKKQYWSHQVEPDASAAQLDFTASLAFELVKTFGSVAAVPQGEDSSGRTKYELQTPEELVSRCFKIANEFVSHCEKEGHIRELMPIEERVKTAANFRKMGKDITGEKEPAAA
jgi:hypothetical protein